MDNATLKKRPVDPASTDVASAALERLVARHVLPELLSRARQRRVHRPADDRHARTAVPSPVVHLHCADPAESFAQPSLVRELRGGLTALGLRWPLRRLSISTPSLWQADWSDDMGRGSSNEPELHRS